MLVFLIIIGIINLLPVIFCDTTNNVDIAVTVVTQTIALDGAFLTKLFDTVGTYGVFMIALNMTMKITHHQNLSLGRRFGVIPGGARSGRKSSSLHRNQQSKSSIR